MTILEKQTTDFETDGFTKIEHVYSDLEIDQLLRMIDEADKTNETFRQSTDLFAIRQFLKEIPNIANVVFNENLKNIILQLFGEAYFVVKSIYFDKPSQSNWYVSYHQDLTISVDTKVALHNFGPWTKKHNQFAVQPPIELLEQNFTIRIHLDETDENNGALRVIPKSHLKKIYRPETIDWLVEKETTCSVGKGGIMLMRPLLLHSSNRTTNDQKRRVIHIEFSSQELPAPLNWSERMHINQP